MQVLTVAALDKNLPTINDFIHSQIQSFSPSAQILFALDLAVEEIFVNIAHYAYTPESGDVTIKCTLTQEPLMLTVSFTDAGVPYNPLLKPDPDITQKLEDRRIGGMGIYLTKKYVDSIAYTYADKKNILTISKKIQ